jgi:hypothetical protein
MKRVAGVRVKILRIYSGTAITIDDRTVQVRRESRGRQLARAQLASRFGKGNRATFAF